MESVIVNAAPFLAIHPADMLYYAATNFLAWEFDTNERRLRLIT